MSSCRVIYTDNFDFIAPETYSLADGNYHYNVKLINVWLRDACWIGSSSLVKDVLMHAPDINYVGSCDGGVFSNMTPLMLLCARMKYFTTDEDILIAEMLINNGSDVEFIENKKHVSILQMACKNALNYDINYQIIKLLLKHTSNIYYYSDEKKCAKDYATENTNALWISSLFNFNDVELKFETKRFQEVTKSYYLDKYLYSYTTHLDKFYLEMNMCSAWFIDACVYGTPSIVNDLIKYKPNLTERTISDLTPLEWCCYNIGNRKYKHDFEIIKIILESMNSKMNKHDMKKILNDNKNVFVLTSTQLLFRNDKKNKIKSLILEELIKYGASTKEIVITEYDSDCERILKKDWCSSTLESLRLDDLFNEIDNCDDYEQ